MTQSISSLSGRTTGKGTVPAAVFSIAVLLGLGLNAETIELSAPFGRYSISNIRLNNIHARCADRAFEINGDPELPPKGLHFRNVRVDSVRKEFSKIVNAHDVTFSDVSLGSMTPVPWRRK